MQLLGMKFHWWLVCALVSRERISAIVKARENVRGTWNKNE